MKARKYIKLVSFWAVVAITFVIAGAYLVILASGYKVNLQEREIQKTSLLIVRSTPKEAVVYLNDRVLEDKTPVRQAGLLSGWYEIKVEKAGHQSWRKSLRVEEGLAYDFDKVVLFLENPQIEKLDTKPESLTFIQDSQLFFSNGEIWYGDRLVTRLSQDIKHAVVYPDKAHIAFQVKGEIRIVDLDGTNNTLLAKLNSEDKIVFGFQDEDTLIFQDGDSVKRARIL